MTNYYQSDAYARLAKNAYKYTAHRAGDLLYFKGVSPYVYGRKYSLYLLSWPFHPWFRELMVDHARSLDVVKGLDLERETRARVIPAFHDGVFDFPDASLLTQRGFTREEKATIILFTAKHPSFEEYASHLDARTQAGIERLVASGEYIFKRIESRVDLKKAYAVYRENRKRESGRFSGDSFHQYEKLWRDPAISLYAIFDTHGRCHCVQGVIAHEDLFLLFGVSNSNYTLERKLNTNDLLQYRVVQEAFVRGIKQVDWIGYSPATADPKLEGINRFKRKWLGDVVTYAAYRRNEERLPVRAVRALHRAFTKPFRRPAGPRADALAGSRAGPQTGTQTETRPQERTLAAALRSPDPFPYKEYLRNQLGYLEKEYGLSKSVSCDELERLLARAERDGVESYLVPRLIGEFLTSRDIDAALARLVPKTDMTARIDAILDANAALLVERGMRAKGHLIAIIKNELGAEFDGKLANALIEARPELRHATHRDA